MRLSHEVNPSGSGVSVLAAAPLDPGALRSSQASGRLWRRAAALVPSSRLTSTRMFTRAGHDGLRQASRAVSRMLAERHNKDNEGVADFLLRESLIFSSGFC
jgi:hypothetical protein